MKTAKRILSVLLAFAVVLSCWVWVSKDNNLSEAANLTGDSNYLFAYFTGTSLEGQTIHLAVSKDGLNYTALRNNEPVIIPSKGVGNVRDPYIWYNEQDNYYYILATDLDFTDTGSDYSDNSESFIVWRSKDLVHWYDETMIDVKEMGHLIGDVGNMQAVWAPQVLWDGESYVVYFSLQCNFTGINNGWNNLQIVYLRTTDLLDQDAYYEFGTILDPQRHVIDADIIKKPGTEQYYMFYKDEAASTGIQSIYYMISDNGPTGPYYAPNNANDGRGPQLFSDIGKNLEGCNSFFDDNGDLITFVDEYDYTNAAGQKEAHFHVSRSSDFSTFTTLDDSVHNINSLSPRHGSVVKITDEEYNRLVNNAYGITSSSFPASDTLSDHLVGRYFTTQDYTYNAANGKNDLTLTDGEITTGQEGTGEWFAQFTSAGAEIDLASIIPGDLNIKDGFTITFNALVSSGLDRNTYADMRFFDVSNNWSKRSDPDECYLHMSPVAEGNGGYLGLYNAPVSGDWPWLSLDHDFNDDIIHEYMISCADGNLIVYIDGKLALKRDRYNLNPVGTDNNGNAVGYGDKWLDDNWYKELGNSKMKIGKSEWPENEPLLTGYIQDFCIYDRSMSYYDIITLHNELDIKEGVNPIGTPSYPGITSIAPSFEQDNPSPIDAQYYANILYSPLVDGPLPYNEGEDNGNPDSNRNRGQAVIANQNQYTNVGIYYSKDTVMFVDGITTPKMPVMLAARINKNKYDSKMIKAYPSASASSTADNPNFYLTQAWGGWTRTPNFSYAISNPDGTNQQIGHNSSTNKSADLDDANSQGDRSVYYYGSVLALNTSTVTFNSNGYNKYNLSWYWEASTSGSNSSSGNASYNEASPSSDHLPGNIWVVDLRDYISAYNDITKNYDSIVKNKSYCPGAIASYKAIVAEFQKFNPTSYNYAGGTETAVAACSLQAQKLANEYYTVKAQLGPCDTTNLPAREPVHGTGDACMNGGLLGLTEGSYCSKCGKFYQEQTTYSTYTVKIPDSAHQKVKADYKVNGEYWHDCSVCGNTASADNGFLKNYYWVGDPIPYELSYDNLFLFSEWAVSNSSNIGNAQKGSIEVNGEAGTIKFRNFNNTAVSSPNDLFSACGFNSSGANSNSTHYNIGVTAGTDYTFEYTTAGGTGDQVHIFFYNANGAGVAYAANRGNPFANAYGNGHNTNYISFTPPEGTVKVGIRFGTTVVGETVTFSNIALYVTDRLHEAGMTEWSTRLYRETFFYGESLLDDGYRKPSRTGFTFNTYYIDNHRDGLINNLNGADDWAAQITNYTGLFKFADGLEGNYILLSDWTEHTYSIIFDTNGGTGSVASINNVPYTSEVALSSASGISNAGFQFIGWSTDKNSSSATYADGAKVSKLAGGAKTGDSITLYAIWGMSDELLSSDIVVIDFGSSPIVIEPLKNDTDFLNVAKNGSYQFLGISSDGTNYTNALDKTYGSFSVNGENITYTPSSVINGCDSVYYHVAITLNGKTNNLKETITVAPASNILYEESFFEDSNALTGVAWEDDDDAKSNENQESSPINDEIYGYDSNTAGYNRINNYSNGSAKTVTVTADNRMSKNTTFTFSGTGFDLNGVCGSNTGVMIVSLRENNADGTVTMKKSYVVDTYYGDTAYGTLYQVPIINERNLPHGNYTVQVVASYLPSMSGAIKADKAKEAEEQQKLETGSVNGIDVNTASGADNEALRNALAEIGMEYVLDAESVEVVWFDDNSILNGGMGVNTPVASDELETASLSGLVNVIDSIRVYNPLDTDDSCYNSNEKNATYYNVIDNLVDANGGLTGNNNNFFAYVTGKLDDGVTLNITNYMSVGPKDELYLAGSDTDGITFTIKNFVPGTTKVMISLRAASGTPMAKFGDKSFNVISNTEMYYDITDYVDEVSGVVTIQNTTSKTLLSVGSLKITSPEAATASLSTEFDLMTARTMMMAEAEEVEPNTTPTPEEPVNPEEPSTDDSSECWLIRIFKWVIEMFIKLIDIFKGFFRW